MTTKIEYVYANILILKDGKWKSYYKIYEKIGDKYMFVDESTNYFDTFTECKREAEKHIAFMDKGEE